MEMSILRLLESERFIEAIYFGALQIPKSNNAQLHLYMGLACCGTIKPIAELQRYMADPAKTKEFINLNGLILSRDTTMVYEGFFHLVEAKRKNTTIIFPESLMSVVKLVINDLEDYLTQEFHGYSSEYRKYDLRTVGFASYILLKELINDKNELKPKIKRMEKYALELLEEVKKTESGDAEFYKYWIEKKDLKNN